MPVKIHGKEYLTVAERIGRLNKEAFIYSLNTELVSWEDGVVIMKATLTISNDDDVQTYTGHAYERESSSQINKISALENCETSAIGRALAAAGFGGTEYASADEVANAIHKQKPMMTEAQENKIRELIGSHHITDEKRISAEGWLSDPQGHTKESATATINMLTQIIEKASGLEK